jgi:hypothetical protein
MIFYYYYTSELGPSSDNLSKNTMVQLYLLERANLSLILDSTVTYLYNVFIL